MIQMDEEVVFLDLIEGLKQFETLDCFPGAFNVFEAVGMIGQEIKHSNFLAFLLDPNQKHPFGDVFVRSLLMQAARNSSDKTFSPLEVALQGYSDLEVYREWHDQQISKRKIDIVMVSRKNRAVYVIENKVGATESKDQLSDYRVCIERHADFDGYEKRYVFLTPDASEPSDSIWATIDYDFIVLAVEDLLKTYAGKLSDGLQQILKDYVTLLRRYVVEDYKLKEACQRIYELHKTALDLIFEHGDVKRGYFADAAQAFFKKQDGLEIQGAIHPKRCAFLPKELVGLIPNDPSINWHKQSKPILMWFEDLGEKVKLLLEVGPLSDKEQRANIVKELRKLFNYKSSSDKGPSDTYSRCWTRTIKVSNADDDAMKNMLAAMTALWESLGKATKENEVEFLQIIGTLPQSISNAEQ